MALIKCPDCGKMISDKSTMCIWCGRPMNESKSIDFRRSKSLLDINLPIGTYFSSW